MIMIITIDGPSGTGKSTIAKKLADKLNFSYFDTGAMYRAIAWLILQQDISLSDQDQLTQLLERFDFIIKDEAQERRYFIGDLDITQEIRKKEVTDFVSEVSALRSVRSFLLEKQKQYAKQRNAVFEGRDLGTVVFPDAEIKIFLTASPEIRAKRRFEEIVEKDPLQKQKISETMILDSLKRRDAYDSTREIAPLKCPEDAYVIDTSDLSIEEVVEKVMRYALNKQLI
jgi:CMP/dCMP kinase